MICSHVLLKQKCLFINYEMYRALYEITVKTPFSHCVLINNTTHCRFKYFYVY